MSVLFAAQGCGTAPAKQKVSERAGPVDPVPKPPVLVEPSMKPTPLQRELASAPPAQTLPPTDVQSRLGSAMDAYFARAQTRRGYIGVDKPLYQPGEVVWFRAWQLRTADWIADAPDGQGATFQLISPKGAAVLQKRVAVAKGVATNDFELPAGVSGGEYTLRAVFDSGGFVDRKIIVSSYQAPRIKKKLEFLRKAYGAGDKVSAAVALHRATGEALAATTATGVVIVDGAEVARVPVTTNAEGKAIVTFELPDTMSVGDGLLTILVDDGGVTESVQKRIPITLAKLQLSLFPEGGDLVAGLPARVYYSAKNLIGKPADIKGRVVDDTGRTVGEFASYHDGMGRFELTPAAGRSYHVEIASPRGIDQTFPLPAAKPAGCTMQSVDDFKGEHPNVRVAVWCSEAQTVVATAVLRETRLGAAAVDVPAAEPTIIALPAPTYAQGAVRVTLFDDNTRPLAERLVYRGRGKDLAIAVTADKTSYAPRDKVTLAIHTRDLAGKPVQADVAVAVADDSVLSFADDKTAHMLTELYLESEMPGQEIEEPNFYFENKPKSGPGLDLVLGTHGWRRFQWQPVFAQRDAWSFDGEYWSDELGYYRRAEVAVDATSAPAEVVTATGMAAKEKKQKGVARKPVRQLRPQMQPPAPPMAAPMPPADNKPVAGLLKNDRAGVKAGRMDGRFALEGDLAEAEEPEMADDFGGEDRDWNNNADAKDEEAPARNRAAMGRRGPAMTWAAVRVFPVPTYKPGYDGARTDFRETVLWAPSVRTNAEGVAEVSFYLNDSVTSFRAIAEGTSRGGLPGRADTLVKSVLPVSLAMTMPMEVSAGDRVRLPVTLSNETDRPYTAAVDAKFGRAFKLLGGVPKKVSLGAGQRKSFFYELEVVGNGAELADGKVEVAVSAANLSDRVERTIDVVPLGFPREHSVAGTVATTVRHEIDLAGMLPDTTQASLTMYPSPLATMTEGTEAIIREPTGCFEQASSANYPNIMVLSYLESHDAADPDLVAKTHGMLDRGYKKLTGYESPKKGYEWFGGDPGHEALTAYGLMEFADMGKVYDDVDRDMVKRTAAWLLSRRDGKGGYQRNARALDSFGRASIEVTNGYVTYALTEAGITGELDKEIAYQQAMAKSTKDPYVMALATNALLNVGPDSEAARAAVTKLAGMRNEDGAYLGADHSITRSGGAALAIETTSLATLALMKAGPAYELHVRKSIEWLDGQRSGYGAYGSTQSTVLALKTMSTYASQSRATRSGGSAQLRINGEIVGRIEFEKGRRDALEFTNLGEHLRPGKNIVELTLESEEPLPYSMAVAYRTAMPASNPETAVAVSTRLGKSEVPMGESVTMHVTTKNITDEGVPMTIARVGLPGGLAFQTWQLKELKDKGLIDFYETRDREVILYFRSLAPQAQVDLNLELLARVPGDYVAPASRAYLYYTDEYKDWAEPVRVKIAAK